MYNGIVIEHLLRERHLRKKDLISALGWTSVSQLKSVMFKNPTANTLEKIADYFGVTIDTFFNREVENVDDIKMKEERNAPPLPVENYVIINERLMEQLDSARDLLKEKDKRIETLEKLIAMLESKTATGQ